MRSKKTKIDSALKQPKPAPKQGRPVRGHAKSVQKTLKEAGYVLNLFVAGATARSHQAVLSVNDLCRASLKDGYALRVFDIYQQPELAKEFQIVATPTLIKVGPSQSRRFIGIQGIIAGLSAEIAMHSVDPFPA